MTTVDQFLKALAVVESKYDPDAWEAWGDGGNGDTWNQVIAEMLRTIWTIYHVARSPVEIAMYWHRGHWVESTDADWDAKYAARFGAAMLNAQEEMP